MLVVPDIEGEMYAPVQDSVAFVDPYASRNVIQPLLVEIPNRFAEQPAPTCALGASLRGVLALLARRGGQTVLFLSSVCSVGPGVAQSRLGFDENKMYDTDREKELFKPSSVMWVDLAEEMSDEGIGVSPIVATGTSTSVDFASLGMLSDLVSVDVWTDLFTNRISNQLHRRRRTAFSSLQCITRRSSLTNTPRAYPQTRNRLFLPRTSACVPRTTCNESPRRA